MCELTDRSLDLESKLRDLDCPTIEISLAAARLMLEEQLASEDHDDADVGEYRMALTGALALAVAVVEQFSVRPKIFALDGDVQVGPYSYAPGKMCQEFRAAITKAEAEAKSQRDDLLAPVVRSMIVNAQRDELEHLGVSVQ